MYILTSKLHFNIRLAAESTRRWLSFFTILYKYETEKIKITRELNYRLLVLFLENNKKETKLLLAMSPRMTVWIEDCESMYIVLYVDDQSRDIKKDKNFISIFQPLWEIKSVKKCTVIALNVYRMEGTKLDAKIPWLCMNNKSQRNYRDGQIII